MYQYCAVKCNSEKEIIISVDLIFFPSFNRCDPAQTSQTVQKRFYQKDHLKKRKVITREDQNQFYWNFLIIVHECKCQLFIWSVYFSCAEKTNKSSSENGGNFINKNWLSRKYRKIFYLFDFQCTDHFCTHISLSLCKFARIFNFEVYITKFT